ncbi:MAG: hypothetical protein ACI9KE_004992 [Polyangiales bacterium]|jgi:hypothetical protein
MRFALDEVLAEKAAREARKAKAKAKVKKPTWRAIRGATPTSGGPELNRCIRAAYAELIAALGPKSSVETVTVALEAFFVKVYAHRQSAEYRDEIANIGADVGEALGMARSDVYGLAEEAM